MGDIDNTPTATGKGNVRIRGDMNDSPSTEVGGVTIGLDAMTLTTSSNTDHEAGPSCQKPIWGGPKQEEVGTGKNPFGGQYMNAAVNDFQPGGFNTTVMPDTHTNIPQAYLQQKPDHPLIVHSTPVGAGKVKQPGRDSMGNPLKFNLPLSTDTRQDGAVQPRHFVKIDNVVGKDISMVPLIGEVLHSIRASSEAYSGKECLLICFNDLRDACKTAEIASSSGFDWDVQYIPDSLFKDRTGIRTTAPNDGTSKYDGQLIFVAKMYNHKQTGEERLRADEVPDLVHKLASSFGDVMAVQPFKYKAGQCFRVEYFSITLAKEVAGTLNGYTMAPHHHKGWDVTAEPFANVLAANARHADVIMSPTGRTAWRFDQMGNMIVEKPAVTVPKAAPTATATSNEVTPWVPAGPSRPRGGWSSLPMPQTQEAFDQTAMARSASYPVGEHAVARISHFTVDDRDAQNVNIDRINNGQDVRTTVMVRNLPNNWTCDDMKEVLDKTSFGEYDFAYLRIDFERNLNVGYGFVNFVDAEAIIPFAEHYQNQDWNQDRGQQPRRLGQISYATVQGYDCLIEKFRNSAIMDECPGYRPKLFWTKYETTNQDLIGTEKVFPGPNNLTKHKRSAENAGQIGLFQPNSRGGDRVRGGDRARRSQYDRGTTRQMQEDASYYYAHAAGPAFGGMAPIGTPAMFAQQGGYAPPYFNGFAPMEVMNYMAQYPQYGQFPPIAGPQQGYPAGNPMPFPYGAPGQAGYGYQTNNRASQLRTLTEGRLATRPRGNVTIADPSRFDPAPGVPRSIVANTGGEFPAADQYAGQQYFAGNNGYQAGVANGNSFHYPQY
ncbi:hypothetical protein PRZ48_007464 [Zasmidium cellare]|uniref:RRM domain-containing protein n=1 Tax=Zasmidium cellare TaxID=395010 RepID=A0ABR0EK72_ZASCE|nr:hypothetical protein PRZ48_007464 [Zasmidium cellare]